MHISDMYTWNLIFRNNWPFLVTLSRSSVSLAGPCRLVRSFVLTFGRKHAHNVGHFEISNHIAMLDIFKYLGSTVTWDSDMVEEVKLRIAAALKCSWALNKILKSKFLSRRTKLQVYATMIRPIATYASETWSLTKQIDHMLLVFERRIFRRIFGPVIDDDTGELRMSHNVEIREISDLPPITSYVRDQRLM